MSFGVPGTSYRRPWTDRARIQWDRLFLVCLACSLAAYAVFGKGFASVGVPPLYAGEFLLILGTIALVRSRCVLATMGSIPSLILLALVIWVLFRVAGGFPVYGVDSLRDSVVVLYALFAFCIAGVLLDQPDRLPWSLSAYDRFCGLYPIVAPIILIVTTFVTNLPTWPGSGLPIFSVRAGEVAVHLAGVTAFVLLGFGHLGWFRSGGLLLGIGFIFAQSRGGAMAIAIPAMIAAVIGQNRRQLAQIAVLGILLLVVALLLDVSVNVTGGRQLGFEQIAANVASIFGDSSTGDLDGTKRWRLKWWSTIIQYTLHGEYFWAGKGFGINLAVADGYVVGLEAGGPPLRSPHNVHLTILARSGVIGSLLWFLTLAAWFAMMARNWWLARRRGDLHWSKLFVFIACYVMSIVIDASFDVAIEGPMLGIWFWVLIGFGLGASMLYWSRYPSRSMLRRAALPAALLATVLLTGSRDLHADETRPPERVTNPTGTCMVVYGRQGVTIENVRIGPCAGHGIEIVNSRSVLVRNVTIEHTAEIGIRILSSDDVTVRNTTFIDTLSGIHAQESGALTISCNSFKNMRGPIPRGQFVQFDKVRGPGMAVSCNVGRNEPGRSDPEDAISMYRSEGTIGSPIIIEKNVISGGGPSTSGGGIMLGDAGGAYLVARDNVLEDPGQYGIGVAGGHDIEITGNVIVARRQPFTNVGISVWRQSPGQCHSIKVSNNQVNWVSKSGRPNPWWDAKNCGPVSGVITNNFNASPVEVDRARAALNCGC